MQRKSKNAEMSSRNQFYYKKDRLNQLRGFCATVQCDSCAAKAAEFLCLEPGTIGQQIRSLESELNIDLFKRTSNKLELTQEGRKFYEMAIPALQQVDGLFQNFMKVIEDERKNIIKIAGHYIVLSEILPKYLSVLLAKEGYKDLKIKLISIKKEEAISRVIKGEIDLAFYPSVITENIKPEIQIENIFKYKNVLVLNKNHPLALKKYVTLKDIEEYKYMILDNYSFYDPRQNIKFNPSNIEFENANWEIMMGLIKYNIGISGMSDKIVNRYSNFEDEFVTKDFDRLLPIMYYTIYTKKKIIQKKPIEFLINILRKDKEEYEI